MLDTKGGTEMPFFAHQAEFSANKQEIWDWYIAMELSDG